MFIGACVEIKASEILFVCVSAFVMKTICDFPSGLCTGVE